MSVLHCPVCLEVITLSPFVSFVTGMGYPRRLQTWRYAWQISDLLIKTPMLHNAPPEPLRSGKEVYESTTIFGNCTALVFVIDALVSFATFVAEWQSGHC